MTGHGNERKGELIKIKLAEILNRSSGNPKFESVTIVDVKLSPDSTTALIFFAVYTTRYQVEEIAAALNQAAGFFQSKLSKTLKSRNLPKIHFTFDSGFDNASKIDRILQKIHEES